MIAPEISPGIPEVPVVNDVFIVPRKVPRVVRHYRNDRPDYRRAKYAGDSRTDAGCPETYQARNPRPTGRQRRATGRRCWREVKYERHQRIHASDRRCREPAGGRLTGAARSAGAGLGSERTDAAVGVDVERGTDPVSPHCS
jgi:hypothetical protein